MWRRLKTAGQRVVRRLFQQLLAGLPLRRDVDDRRQQRVVAGEAQPLARQRRPERSPAGACTLRFEPVDAAVAKAWARYRSRSARFTQCWALRPLDLFQRHSKIVPARRLASMTVWSAMRVSTIATGEKSTSARRLASLSCRSRVRSLIFVSSASRSTRRASRSRARRRSPAPGRRSRRTSWPAAPRAASSGGASRCARDRRPPPSCPVERPGRRASSVMPSGWRYGRGNSRGALVGQGVVGAADRPLLLQRLEIARHVGGLDARAGRVPVLRAAHRDRCTRSPRPPSTRRQMLARSTSSTSAAVSVDLLERAADVPLSQGRRAHQSASALRRA